MKDSDRYHINDHGNDEYTLYVDEKPVVVIKNVHDIRQCYWQVYGPADLDRSIVLMKGFLHLLTLLGDEERVYGGAPDVKAPLDRKGVSHELEEEPRGDRKSVV